MALCIGLRGGCAELPIPADSHVPTQNALRQETETSIGLRTSGGNQLDVAEGIFWEVGARMMQQKAVLVFGAVPRFTRIGPVSQVDGMRRSL